MVTGEEHKLEYPNYFYVDNTMPGVDPGAYDTINKNFSECGANIRFGPPLDAGGKMAKLMGLQVTCGIYMREKDIKVTPRRNISLDQAIKEMDLYLGG